MKGEIFGTKLIGEESDLTVFEKATELISKNQPYEVELKIYKKDRTVPYLGAYQIAPCLMMKGRLTAR
jgi:hypothetical protein